MRVEMSKCPPDAYRVWEASVLLPLAKSAGALVYIDLGDRGGRPQIHSGAPKWGPSRNKNTPNRNSTWAVGSPARNFPKSPKRPPGNIDANVGKKSHLRNEMQIANTA